ncbi:MAG: hypothetical protein GC191_01595 [Azospirillum sp.]|nr:hypothetical protein [Azospirillum sp.]
MNAQYIEGFLFAGLLSLLAFLIGQFIVGAIERTVEKQGRIDQLRATLVRRAKFETALEARRNRLSREIREGETEIRNLTRRKQALERRIGETRNAVDQPVRSIGEEIMGNSCFVAVVTNKYAVDLKNNPDARPGPIDRSWADPQIIEIWSADLAGAKAVLEKRYPLSQGFLVTRIGQESTKSAKANASQSAALAG